MNVRRVRTAKLWTANDRFVSESGPFQKSELWAAYRTWHSKPDCPDTAQTRSFSWPMRMTASHPESDVATMARLPRLQTTGCSTSAIPTQLRPIRQTGNAQTCFDLIRQAHPAESTFDPLPFSSQRKALCAIQLGPARVRGNSKLKVPPEAQIRLPKRKQLPPYLSDFLKESGGAA